MINILNQLLISYVVLEIYSELIFLKLNLNRIKNLVR